MNKNADILTRATPVALAAQCCGVTVEVLVARLKAAGLPAGDTVALGDSFKACEGIDRSEEDRQAERRYAAGMKRARE